MTDQTTPSRRAGLRDEIATALETADYSGNMRRGDLADVVLPVLYREWPWLRAEAEEVAIDPELQAQLKAAIKALGNSETENAELRAALAGPGPEETGTPQLAERIRTAVESEVYEYRERTMFWEETGSVTEEIARLATRGALEALGRPPAPAGTEGTDAENTTRVIDLYDRWVKAGPPPLGASLARWWDARLTELHDAIAPPTDRPEEPS